MLLAVQKYSPILDRFLLPSVRVLVPWPSPVTGPSHLNCVAGVLLPLDHTNIAEHVRTVPLLDVEEEMEISIVYEVFPVLVSLNNLWFCMLLLFYSNIPMCAEP